MGLSTKYVWPGITILVLVGAIFIYFVIPPTCKREENIPHASDNKRETSPSSTTPETLLREPWEREFRIPAFAYPESYNVLLYPDLTTGLFSGTVDVLVNVTDSAPYLVLHISGPTVSATQLATSSGEVVVVSRALEYKPNQFWVVVPERALVAGLYLLRLKFTGSMKHDIVGLYMATYSDSSTGRQRNIATTKFEPTYARRSFPCFDEPSFKAKFNVSLVRPSTGNYIALSNMNQLGEVADSPKPGLTTVNFATSVSMSTYLACFIVCDFEHLPTVKSKGGFDITVYARSSQIHKMEYALKIAASTVDFYTDYFGIDYPLPKLDLIAIPDFVSGAMENWGLITFRETSVLYDPDFSSISNHLAVTLTLTHELAHMWFGNLVTMKWWDDLWLNEGFATFVEFKGTAHNHPDWDMDAIFLIHDLTEAMGLDSAVTSHPIIMPVSHPDKITEIFDSISYAKGASVIRMLEGFMGEDNFRQGVVSYLKAFKYNNAETKDLWSHLQRFSHGINISRVMDTWTRQMGYPVLTVEQKGDTITITQQRFTADKDSIFNPEESQYKYKWDIPVTYITSGNSQFTLNWLLMENSSLSINVGNVEWYKLNWHFKNYYRVNYPPAHWLTLTNLLLKNIKALDTQDRGNLVDDAFSLAESGLLDYSVALGVTTFLAKEDHFVVWAIASSHLLAIDTHLQLTPAYSDYRRYLRKLIAPHINDNLWDFPPDVSFLERSRKVRMISLGCRVGVPSCLHKAKQLFINWLQNNGAKPHVEIRNVVYYHGIAESGEEEWDKMWDLYVAENDPQEKGKLRYGLCASKDPWIIARLIERAKNEDYVRSQDFFILLSSIARSPVGNSLLWDWIRENWHYLIDRFTLSNRSFGRILPTVVGSYSTEVKLKEVETFIEKNPEEGAGGAGRKSAVEGIKLNIAWLQKHLPSLTTWLKNV